ncbi:MAG: FAD-linked oxidase C-terminal domain-containing protein [Pseudomonadota bacterium]
MNDAQAIREEARFPVDRAALLRRLRTVLPDDALVVDSELLRPYECDALTAYRQMPLLVALPANESEVQAVLRICHELRVPVVTRGAATGLSGGAMPHADGVLLCLAKLKQIVKLDPLACTAVVQTGVRNLAVAQAAEAFSLIYAPDPSSQIACTLGGNVAENAGGVHCLKYGLTLHNVLQLRALTIEGEVLTFGSMAPDTPGYDLLALMHGSEGMLAVITEVTLRLLPQPESAKLFLVSFQTVSQAAAAVAAIIAAGIIPAGLEMMDQNAVHAVESYVHAGYDLTAAAILLCELDGVADEIAADQIRLLAILEQSGASRIRAAQNEIERRQWWAGRKAAFPAVGRLTPDYLCMDGTIPRRHLAQMLQTIADLATHYGLRCVNVFHAGDGNLHPVIMYDSSVSDQLERAMAFGAEILEHSVRLGGSITGEHGVGVEKLAQMCLQFTPSEIALFHRLKWAFDPAGLLNPGKAIPTPARCREYRQARAMSEFSHLGGRSVA